MQDIDLFIIGAQKAGTTALKNYLSEHPEILSHPQTEFAYYRDDHSHSEDYAKVFEKHFSPKKHPAATAVVAKNASLYENEAALERLSKHHPNCKVVLLLREPVARAYSSYKMEVFNGWLNRDFSDLKGIIEACDYQDSMYRLFVRLGLYIDHVRTIKRFFPPEQFRCFLFEDFVSNPIRVCEELFDWIRVDSTFCPQTGVRHNIGKAPRSAHLSRLLMSLRREGNPVKKVAKAVLPYRVFTRLGQNLLRLNQSEKKVEPISEEMRFFLAEFFAPYNKELQLEVDLDLARWTKP